MQCFKDGCLKETALLGISLWCCQVGFLVNILSVHSFTFFPLSVPNHVTKKKPCGFTPSQCGKEEKGVIYSVNEQRCANERHKLALTERGWWVDFEVLFPHFLNKVGPFYILGKKEIQVLVRTEASSLNFSALCFICPYQILNSKVWRTIAKVFFSPSDQVLNTVFTRYVVISQSLSLRYKQSSLAEVYRR